MRKHIILAGLMLALATMLAPGGANAGGCSAPLNTDGSVCVIGVGTPADVAWTSGDGTLVALLKNIANGVGGPIPAGSSIIGDVMLDALGSGATAGQSKRLITCDLSQFYDASTNGKSKVVTGIASRKVYICGYDFTIGATATNVSIGSGTGTNCGTTFTAITPAFELGSGGQQGMNSPFWNGLVAVNNGDDLCINTSAGNPVQFIVFYAIL